MKLDKRFVQIDMLPIYKYTLANSNLRKEISTSSDVLLVIPKYSKVEVIDEYDEWSKVKYNSNIGYIHKDLLSISKYPWSNLNLREETSTQSKIIAVIPKGVRIEIIDNLGDWSKVIYNEELGYIFNYFLSDDGNNPNILDYTNFYKDMSKFVNENKIKSPTDYLLVTDLKNKYTYVFKKDNNIWINLYKWKCTVGKPSTPTISGIFYINGRKSYFGTEDYSVKYATRIKDGYYYHSILYDSTGSYVIDGRIGKALSHGCIRLELYNAKWIYDNILDTTTTVIH
ncbi:MAG: L,D-transpeptidase family protein [Paraclostridium sp.]|uniref:L,D-transpeptidase family protein n=1 Tax=Paraclostridium sp. TaxID=2023273 RepID=UPI003F3C70DB